MRLFEVLSYDSLALAIRNYKGENDIEGEPVKIPFAVIHSFAKDYGFPVGSADGDTQQMSVTIADVIDKERNFIEKILPDGALQLKLPNEEPVPGAENTGYRGKSINAMANSAANHDTGIEAMASRAASRQGP